MLSSTQPKRQWEKSMPLYEFYCKHCQTQREKLQGYQDPAPECCGKPTTKLVSRGSFILKGDGWYRDGYQKGKDSGNNS